MVYAGSAAVHALLLTPSPLVGAGLVLIAGFVGKYWPRGERMFFKLRERRELVTRTGMERLLQSLVKVWKEGDEGSAWSHMGIALLQGDDFDIL